MKVKKISSGVAPVTLAQARTQLRIIPFGSPLAHPDDEYITSLIEVATDWCEEYTGREIRESIFEVVMDDFPLGDIKLPLSPVKSITSITYKDMNGVVQTLNSANYTLDTYGLSNLIYLVNDTTYPDVFDEPNAVKITCVAGYTTIPNTVNHAIKLIISNYYENRQEDILSNARLSFNSLPMGVKELLNHERVDIGL